MRWLCIFAFNYKPYVTADLYRLRQYITYWTEKSLQDLISYALRHSAPEWVFYSYFLNKLGNINWLQTITCLWCFGNVFYIISHEIERNALKGKSRSLPLLYVMAIGAFYLQTISGIRSMLGLSIIALCLYRETIENKSLLSHMLLYLFAALLHSSAMPLVVARFVFLIIQYKSASKKILLSVLVLGLGLFSIYYLRDFINEALNVGQSYLFGEREYTYKLEDGFCVLTSEQGKAQQHHQCHTAEQEHGPMQRLRLSLTEHAGHQQAHWIGIKHP